MIEKKLPAEWQEIDDILIVDPDGWDRKNYIESWNTPITRDEWNRRAFSSTIARLSDWNKRAEART